jgi:WhiB family transcriptional regulator, redox-sensing transcriptional regulator
LVAAQHITWQQQAECRGPQAAVFFPPPRHERRDEKLEREQRAKAICQQCAVRPECLSYAIDIKEQHGIWGGQSESERRHLIAVR